MMIEPGPHRYVAIATVLPCMGTPEASWQRWHAWSILTTYGRKMEFASDCTNIQLTYQAAVGCAAMP